MSSRLALDAQGRRIVVVTTPACGQVVGNRYRVLGNALRAGELRIYFLEAEARKTGRPNIVTRPRRTNRDPIPVDL